MKSVTYNDLEGAAPDIEIQGIAFHDGEAIEVEDGMADALDGNRFFDVAGSTRRKPGRPPKVVEPVAEDRPLAVLAAKE